ncbi:MAG: helix-turn-helix transcriptional regulator [Bacteroidales bacterium]|nr:helix-turn-helix transcriptional regulator [Bacteroidales bacterium]
MNTQQIRANIIARRNELGYSQEYVAELLGISINSYSKIENGPTSIISKRLSDIASVLRTTVRELLMGEIMTVEEHNQICKEIEEKHSAEILYYKQHFNNNILLIKTLQEVAEYRKQQIEALTSALEEANAKLGKSENNQ